MIVLVRVLVQAAVTTADDPHLLLHKRIRIFWPVDNAWFSGRVMRYRYVALLAALKGRSNITDNGAHVDCPLSYVVTPCVLKALCVPVVPYMPR